MPAGPFVAIALLAEVAGAAPITPTDPAPAKAYGPVQPAPPKPRVKTAVEPCSPDRPSGDSDEIVVCVERPQGYRLNPDVVEANRARRSGRPKGPERMKDNSCASVGPTGCGPAGGIDLLSAAITAATMAKRLIKGEGIGSMFKTTPVPTEYELYLEAKREREAKEEQAAVEAKLNAKAAERAAAGGSPQPTP